MAEPIEERVVEVATSVPAGAPVWLAVDAEGGRCAVASGVAVDGGVSLGPIGAARVRWLGDAVSVAAEALPACDGWPPVPTLGVPAGGAAVGTRFPVVERDLAGPYAVEDAGEGWWVVRATGDGDGALVFRHDAAPPTAFLLHADPAAPRPEGRRIQLPLGGVLVVEPPPAWSDLPDSGPVRLVAAHGRAIALGRAAGAADGLWRRPGEAPEPLHVEVGGPVRANPDEWWVRAGGHRVRRVDVAVSEGWVADEQVARLEVDERRVRVVGVAPGRTEAALVAGDAVYVVTIAVGR